MEARLKTFLPSLRVCGTEISNTTIHLHAHNKHRLMHIGPFDTLGVVKLLPLLEHGRDTIRDGQHAAGRRIPRNILLALGQTFQVNVHW